MSEPREMRRTPTPTQVSRVAMHETPLLDVRPGRKPDRISVNCDQGYNKNDRSGIKMLK
jgi:hypothetical protein